MKTENIIRKLSEAGFNAELNENGFVTERGLFEVRVDIKSNSLITGKPFDLCKLDILNWVGTHQLYAIREGKYFYIRMIQNNNWGGKRDNSGRKATGRKKVNIMISVLPEEKEKIIELAKQKNVTISKLVLDSLKV